MRYAVALGSNLGDSHAMLSAAVADLAILGEVRSISSLYRSAAVGGPEQEAFLNAVVTVETDLAPRQVLDILHGIEDRYGRERAERWGPRTLDLDLIVTDQGPIEDVSGLVVPHPRALERRFVLDPLAEIWPTATFGGVTAVEALESVLDQDVTKLVGGAWHLATGRGGWWVAGQGAVFVATLTVAVFDAGSAGEAAWLAWVGAGLLVAGAVEMALGVRALGRNLTAYPEPLGGGQLIRSGIYEYVRHPLYGANVLLIAGLAAARQSMLGFVVAGIAGVFFWAKAGSEEARLRRTYPGYEDYVNSTRKRLIPWLV